MRTPGPGPQDGARGPRVHQDTPLPTSPHLHHQQMPGPGSPILRTHKPLPPPLGNPPASVGDRGGGPGWGIPPVHTLPYQPPGINSCWFCFYFNFFFLVLIFLIRIFILSTFILKESVRCVGGSWIQSWRGWVLGEGSGSEGAPSLSKSLCPQVLLPSLFLFSFLFKTVKY